MKTCTRCNSEKPISAFAKRSISKDGLAAWCKQCYAEYRLENKERINQRQNVYREANRERVREWDRRNSRKYTLSKYGLTVADYDAMVADQDGKCLICNKQVELVVDHCHKTGVVRGLLCRGDNAALGQFEDNPQLLRCAARYLEVHDLPDKGRLTGEKSPLS